MADMIMANRLKTLREAAGLSQKDVASLLSVSPPTISKYESGVNEPDAKILRWYADYFECSADYILGRVGAPDEYLTKATFPDTGKEVEFTHKGKDVLTPEEVTNAINLLRKELADLRIQNQKQGV